MKRGGLCLILGLSCGVLFAQDTHFSQFFKSPQLINPAFTGVINSGEQAFRGAMNSSNRAVLNHRSQWNQVGASYSTQSFSYDMNFKGKSKGRKAYLGAGLTVQRDQAGGGILSYTAVNLAISAVLPLSDFATLSAGLQGGAGNRSAQLDNLKWGNQYNGYVYDGGLPSREYLTVDPYWYPDLGMGVMYEYDDSRNSFGFNNVKRFRIGIGMAHVHQPKLRYRDFIDDRLSPKFNVVANGALDIPDTKIGFIPGFFGAWQAQSREFVVGTLVKYEISTAARVTTFGRSSSVAAGVHYRVQDAVIMSVNYIVDKYSLGVSYDVNTSGINRNNGGASAFEVSFQYFGLLSATKRRIM